MPTPDTDDRLARYESLQAALDLIDQGFTLIDQDLRLVACNQAFLRLLDFPASLAYTGAPFEDFIRHNAARGEYGAGDADAHVAERVAAARRFEPHDFERVRPSGQVLRVKGVPVPGIGFITLYSDITASKQAEAQIRQDAAELERRVAERTRELRLSEAQMRLITDSLPVLIGYFDHRKTYRYINHGYQQWFGLDPQRLDRVSARSYLGDATYEAIRPNVARALAGEPVTYEYEVRCVDGRARTARTTLVPERASDGNVIGCFELTFDFTELRRTQQQLAQAEKMEALGQLTGGIAHDFNNMLTVIIGNLSALRDRVGDGEDSAEFLDPTLAAARRGADLIRALLGFARRRPLDAGPVDISPLAHTVVKLLRRSLPDGMKLEVDAGEAPLRAWADASQLQDALVNMILNSRDANARRITVRAAPAVLLPERAAELHAAPGAYVRIDIADDGHGMDAATRSRVFEPFFTTKRQGAGTGLGLSMVYGFVRQSGGAIDIASTPGRGTVVSFWLQVSAGAERADDVDHSLDAAVPAPAAGPALALALLVEDDPDVRKVVRRSLIDLGYAVVEAENGAEALQLLDQTPQIALLLSDVVMPGPVDGREVARHALARHVPRVALMSGYAPGETGGGPEGVPMLAKPFTHRQLIDLLRQPARS